MSVSVDFVCTGCGKTLHSSWPLQGNGLWPKSYRWTCAGCPSARRYILFLKVKKMSFSICSFDMDWNLLPDAPAFDVTFRVREPERVTTCSSAAENDEPRLEIFLQRHAVASAELVPALLLNLSPIDDVRESLLSAELTASTRHGDLAEKAYVGFADAGARSGYVCKRFATRCRQIGAAVLSDPSTISLMRGRQAALRAVSLGGGPGECAMALALCRSVLGMEHAFNLEVALLDLELGWQDCALHLTAELRKGGLLASTDKVWFAAADVTQPLDDAVNSDAAPASQWDLVVFSYVLVENSQALQRQSYCFLCDLFGGLRPGACCVFLDSSTRLVDDIRRLAQGYGLQFSRPRPERGPGRAALANCFVLARPAE